jgi:hypothetical protein
MSSAAIDRISGIYLEVTRNADSPGKLAGREPLPEWRAQPITRIRQNTAEAYAGSDDAVDLRQGDLRFCSCGSIFHRNARSL